MEAQTRMNQKFESLFTQMVEESKEMKSQITKLTGALAVQERGKFPSQAQSNLTGQHMAQTSNSEGRNIKEVNAITTRSGKSLDEPSRTTVTSIPVPVSWPTTLPSIKIHKAEEPSFGNHVSKSFLERKKS
ncbi:hypothetical protein TIFTF001_018797 [Ficus carica]|uniref:Uncharacterized protein n=1 Tax=Ficus carica TaxID=3494 RepID=A0AA88AS92_FICCA|nr:hypothetical protein TIFTF001_018797 [Ficus carica]